MTQAAVKPELTGLVLAGGLSTRMGRDKARLTLAGEPLVVRAARRLEPFAARVLVSVRDPVQPLPAAAAAWPRVVDAAGEAGPAAGLFAAWRQAPESALLVLAADMPRVDAALLEALIAARDAAAIATAYRHADGTPEPLCAIWEPRACELLRNRLSAGSVSLRRALLEAGARLLEAAAPECLASVNSPEEFRRIGANVERD